MIIRARTRDSRETREICMFPPRTANGKRDANRGCAARCRAEDDEQFRREAKPSIVLHEGGVIGGSVSVPTPSGSRIVAAAGVHCGHPLAKGPAE